MDSRSIGPTVPSPSAPRANGVATGVERARRGRSHRLHRRGRTRLSLCRLHRGGCARDRAPNRGAAVRKFENQLAGGGCARARIGFPLLAIPFGHIARSQIRRTGEQGSGVALAGLILGYLSLASL